MNYTDFKNEAIALQAAFTSFDTKYSLDVPDEESLQNAFDQISDGLIFLIDWAKSKEGEVVTPNNPELALMVEFLNKLKALFEEYSASIEYADGSGYGVSYGTGKVAVVRVARGDVDAQHIIPMDDDLLIADDFCN